MYDMFQEQKDSILRFRVYSTSASLSDFQWEHLLAEPSPFRDVLIIRRSASATE